MSNFSTLKATVNAQIKANGNQLITGPVMNAVLTAMINTIGNGYALQGTVAQTTDSPGTPDNPVAYIAGGAGTYTNFGGVVVPSDGHVYLLVWLTSWTAVQLPIQEALVFDNTPTQGSTKGITSGGVYTALADKQDKDTDAVSGNLAMMDSNGNSVDAGYAADNVALQDGSYPNLVAGSAENLVGRGSVAAEYTFRTSGGTDDIGTGTAVIKSMKGKSIVWNQLARAGNSSAEVYGITRTKVSNVCIHYSGESTYSTNFTATVSIPVISGHKYYLATNGIPSTCGIAAPNSIGDSSALIYTASSDNNSFNFGVHIPSGVSIDADVYVVCVDLTLMFGSGNEPTSVDDFTALYPLPYYDANAGAIVSNKATGIKTIGFNQWDEEWELGSFDTSTGAEATSTATIRSTNYVPVFPSTAYYFKTAAVPMVVLFYDANYNYLSYVEVTDAQQTTPSDAAYLRFRMASNYGTSYNSDLCINLSWSGWRDGEYEAYWENTQTFNLATITGVPSGSTISETIFPSGMRSAGDVYDELVADSDGYARRAIKRLGIVDLGTLDYTYDSTNTFRTSALNLAKVPINNQTKASAVCAKYAIDTYNNVYSRITNKTLSVSNTGLLRIYDSDYTDAATFKTAMSGVYLVYELATPVEYTLDTPVYLGYPVDDFGTEQRLPADTESAVTAPISYDVEFPMNAVDTLRRLPVNYLSKASTENLLTALQTAGIISAYTMTYNSTSEEYEFTITQ